MVQVEPVSSSGGMVPKGAGGCSHEGGGHPALGLDRKGVPRNKLAAPLSSRPMLEETHPEGRPRWGFTIGCAAVSLCLMGFGVLKSREALPSSGGWSPPRSGSSSELFADADPLAALTDPSPLPLFAAPVQPPRGSRRASIKVGQMSVSGRLPPEVIGRIVQQNVGRFRLCYEHGLKANPKLVGRVSVRFVIGRDGALSNVGNGGSDLPDGGVLSCVVRAFYGLSFPQPDGGIVAVTYSMFFQPG